MQTASASVHVDKNNRAGGEPGRLPLGGDHDQQYYETTVLRERLAGVEPGATDRAGQSVGGSGGPLQTAPRGARPIGPGGENSGISMLPAVIPCRQTRGGC